MATNLNNTNNQDNVKIEDITPDDSECIIYRVPISEEMQNEMNRLNEEAEKIRLEEEQRELARQSALAKLSKLGLTEEEAKAIIGIY